MNARSFSDPNVLAYQHKLAEVRRDMEYLARFDGEDTDPEDDTLPEKEEEETQ